MSGAHVAETTTLDAAQLLDGYMERVAAETRLTTPIDRATRTAGCWTLARDILDCFISGITNDELIAAGFDRLTPRDMLAVMRHIPAIILATRSANPD